MPPLSNADAIPQRARELLDCWFGPDGDPERETHRDVWFKSTPAHDDMLRRRFLADYEEAAAGKLAAWEEAPETALALVLLLDQLPRNLFRATPRAYATDAMARAAAGRALARGYDAQFPPAWRKFFYMPFHHSEALADQQRASALFKALPEDPERAETNRYSRRYLDIIGRYGRFPHRNAILGRASTPDEIEFLKDWDKRFETPYAST